MNGLNKEILRLALPSILANITVPLVGIVDTAVAGHLIGTEAAVAIGAISVGSMFFSLLYWNCSFLRTGTGGLTAQAYGAGDKREIAKIFWRGMALSGLIALLILLLQWPFLKVAVLCTQATAEVESLAAQYFSIRIWAAPATISLMTFSGWFVGMQDSVSSMWKDLIVNGVNVVASIILGRGIGGWPGLGFAGIAVGTVIAQYCGLLFCVVVCLVKYRKVLGEFHLSELRQALSRSELGPYMRLNGNLFLRAASMLGVYIGYPLIATTMGDMLLACSAVMMQLLMLFSYFTDGFAYAGEALVGRFIGARDNASMRRSVRYVFVWSMSIALMFIGLYWVGGVPVLRLLTSDPLVVQACSAFLPWLILMPPIGCAAFTFDGVFLGATASKPLRDSCIWAFVAFLAVWFLLKWLFLNAGAQNAAGDPAAIISDPIGDLPLHLLMVAYFAHLLVRTVWLALSWKTIRMKGSSEA
ncbi:MAG: MATE family efflux transporter [Bacteroidales bacterium]|nr:MATE family efflux transporter [Bacteroidales bacterium]